MSRLQSFISAILAGITVGIGCSSTLLLIDSRLVSSLTFGIGFLAVAIFELNLFTDRSGTFITDGKVEKNISKLILVLFGNIIGTALCGVALSSRIREVAATFVVKNISGDYIDMLIGSLLCGILVFIGIHGYRKVGGFAGCVLLLSASAMIFLCDFHYALFNVFVIGAGATKFSSITSNFLPLFVSVFLCAIGNALGSIIFATLYKYKDKKEPTHGRRKHHHHHHSSSSSEAAKKEESAN